MAAWRLDGKVAIVTGAGRRNGRAIAQVFGQAGARVLAVDKDSAAANLTADSVTASGGTASAFEAEASTASSALPHSSWHPTRSPSMRSNLAQCSPRAYAN
jgi:NAD(P)-dependent dehydrogenase (short-subunit alcohol dehydrogenase family)